MEWTKTNSGKNVKAKERERVSHRAVHTKANGNRLQQQCGQMLEITGQIGNVLLKSGQWLLRQCGSIQCAYIECMPQFRRRTIESLLAGFDVAMIVGRFTQIHLLRVVGQFTEIVQMQPSRFQLKSCNNWICYLHLLPNPSRKKCAVCARRTYLFLWNPMVHQKRNAFLTQRFLQLQCNAIHHRFLREFLRACCRRNEMKWINQVFVSLDKLKDKIGKKQTAWNQQFFINLYICGRFCLLVANDLSRKIGTLTFQKKHR